MTAPPTKQTGEKRKARMERTVAPPRRCEFDGHPSETVGSLIGTTVGNLVAFLSRPGTPSSRPGPLLRELREFLLPAARSICTSRGVDLPFLARGLAASRVARVARMCIPELQNAKRIDSKYGHVGTGIGATAAVLSAFHLVLTRGRVDHEEAARMNGDNAIVVALNALFDALRRWNAAGSDSDEAGIDARISICAEQRASVRATLGARFAKQFCEEAATPYIVSLRMQAKMALQAAYPRNRDLDEDEHHPLCLSIANGSFFEEQEKAGCGAIHVAVPLSATPLCSLLGSEEERDKGTGGSSTANSSSVGSVGSFESAVSAASNGEESRQALVEEFAML